MPAPASRFLPNFSAEATVPLPDEWKCCTNHTYSENEIIISEASALKLNYEFTYIC